MDEPLRNLDVALLRTFVVVCETGNMTVSGRRLHLTQAAVSLHVKRLEDILGCRVFRRDRRGHQLTAAGERLLNRARHLLAINDAIFDEMAEVAGVQEVRLGIPYDLTEAFLPPVLKALARSNPDVEVALSCSTSPSLLSALERGEIDMAVVEEAADRPEAGRKCERLAMDDLIWVGARDGKAHRQDPVPVAFCHGPGAFNASMLAALTASGTAWRAVSNLSNLEVVSASVKLDLAVSTVLASTRPADVDALSNDTRLPRLPRFAINLYLPSARRTAATGAVAEHLRAAFSTVPA